MLNNPISFFSNCFFIVLTHTRYRTYNDKTRKGGSGLEDRFRSLRFLPIASRQYVYYVKLFIIFKIVILNDAGFEINKITTKTLSITQSNAR